MKQMSAREHLYNAIIYRISKIDSPRQRCVEGQINVTFDYLILIPWQARVCGADTVTNTGQGLYLNVPNVSGCQMVRF